MPVNIKRYCVSEVIREEEGRSGDKKKAVTRVIAASRKSSKQPKKGTCSTYSDLHTYQTKKGACTT
jgi:hypothetical protein